MNSPQITEVGTEAVRAQYQTVRKLGHWTTARRFTVRAQRGHVVLDLRSPQLQDGDIEIELTAERSLVKLLVPEDAVVDYWDLEQVGWCRVRDSRSEENTDGRKIKITGQLRRGQVRIRRGGVAILAAMLTSEYAKDVIEANKKGTMPTVDDPARTAPGTPRPPRAKK